MFRLKLLCFALTVFVGVTHEAAVTTSSANEYGVVIDAGSSGSRIRVYRWPRRAHMKDIPAAEEIFNFKVKPGLSSLAGNDDQIPGYIEGLLQHARDNVPEQLQSASPIYLMATAGMRLVDEDEATSVMRRAGEVLGNSTFAYTPGNARILAGEEEGAFAWIALNYLRGFFADGPQTSNGVLELGGASTQIAFLPDSSLLSNKFPVFLQDSEYPLYVHSYLRYGQTAAIEWTIDEIIKESPGSEIVLNPCMLLGDMVIKTKDGKNITVWGYSDPADCMERVQKAVYKVNPDRCSPSPCAIGPFYQPDLPEDMTFYAVSAFVYTAEDLDEFRGGNLMGQNRTLRPDDLLDAAYEYCALTLSQVEPIFGSSKYASDRCFMGIYIAELFTRAYGFKGDGNQIRVAEKVNGRPIAWPLGALIYGMHTMPLS